MPSIIEAWRAGLFRRESFVRNITAGVVVGVVALPLAMAFAIASGAKPEQGLYTALVAGLVVTLFGGSRVQIAGPTGAFAVLLFGVTAKYGFAGLQVVTILAGVMLLVLGISKLGSVIRYIPESVILGFTAGIAIVIWVGQWGNFLGLPAVTGATLYERLPELLAALPKLDLATTALGVASVLVVVLWPKVPVAGKIRGRWWPSSRRRRSWPCSIRPPSPPSGRCSAGSPPACRRSRSRTCPGARCSSCCNPPWQWRS